MAVSLSIASIPASVITAYASWHATIQNFMPEALEQDAEGLNAILNMMSTGTWGAFSIAALAISLLVSFTLHAAGAGILWVIYAIIYHSKQKTEYL